MMPVFTWRPMNAEERSELLFNMDDENPDAPYLVDYPERLLGVVRRCGEPSTFIYQDNDGKLARIKPEAVYLMDYDYRPLVASERSRILSRLNQMDSKALSIDDHESALLGVAHKRGQRGLLVYSVELIIENLMAQGMSEEEAWEFHEHNIAGAYMGPGTPLLL